MVVLGFVVFLLAGLLIGVADNRQERLEKSGDRLTGIVVRVVHPLRGPDTVAFRYAVDDQTYTAEIYGSEYYKVGDRVTVFVDPRDPRNATLPDEQPQSRPTFWLTLLMITASIGLVMAGLLDLWKLWRTRRS